MQKAGWIITIIALIGSLGGAGWLFHRLDKKIDSKSEAIMARIDSNQIQKKLVDSLVIQSALSKSEAKKSAVRIVYLKAKRDTARPPKVEGIEMAYKILGI